MSKADVSKSRQEDIVLSRCHWYSLTHSCFLSTPLIPLAITTAVGIPNRTSYASSKFAVQGYCEALRSEVATSGITVHVASPGYICTNLGKSAITGDGSPYAKVDASALAGADPNDVAIDILDKSAAGKADFLTAADFNAKAAIFLKFFAPSFLNQKLVKRYEKSQRPDA